METSPVQEIDDRDFQREVLETPGLVLVDFWAPWCGPCRMLAPVLEKLGTAYKDRARVLKLNVDVNGFWADQLKVRGIPTLYFFRDGEPVDVQVGYLPEAALQKKIEALLAA